MTGLQPKEPTAFACAGKKASRVRFATFNLRIDLESDGRYRWRYRLPEIIAWMKKQLFGILCVQEPSPAMLSDLLAAMPRYRSVGVARDARGEATPILYDADALILLDTETIWLTNTPERESTLPGSYFPRIATFARFQMPDGGVFQVVNTHLDYAGPNVRNRHATVLLKHLDARQGKNPLPTVIAGDFNALPDEAVHSLFDAMMLQSVYGDAIPNETFHGFDPATIGATIDYIYCGYGMRAVSWNVVKAVHSSLPLSDHDPIEAVLTFSSHK